MYSPSNLEKPAPAVVEKLNAQIKRLEDERADPSLAHPLAPYREQITKLHVDLQLGGKAIAAILNDSGLTTTPAKVTQFCSYLPKRKTRKQQSTATTS
jgi:hypothetical protein